MKGQAFSVFKILIGAVFAVAMLSIIYSIVSSYSSPIPGIQTISDLIKQANNAPEQCFSRPHAQFNMNDNIDKDSFLPAIVALHSTESAVDCGSGSCKVAQTTDIPVSVKCSLSQCDIYFASSTCGY